MTGERKRGILTEDPDREFLRGEKSYQTIQGTRDRQGTIRQRLYDGVLDFTVIQKKLSDWNWRKFVDMNRQEEMDLQSGMVAAIALFYEIHHSKGWDFQTTLRDGVDQAHTYGTQRQMPRRIVEGVEFEPDTREPEKYRDVQERIENKIERGENLTDHEKSVAVDMGGALLKRVHKHSQNRGQRKREEKALDRVEERSERHGSKDDE